VTASPRRFSSAVRFRPFTAWALAGALCVVMHGAWAQPRLEAAGPAARAPEVRAWLMRIHEAASHRNFQGTFVVSGGGTVSSARIAHYCEGPNQYERSESLDGQARYVFRYNDLVHTVWPGARVAMVEQRTLMASFPALLQAGDDRIVDFYDVHPEGVERVAGHVANVLWVKPKDGLRYGYRLWADQASGLLLRSDVLGERNEVLETSAFSDVLIGVKSQPESVMQPMKRLEGYRVLKPVMTPTRLDAEGWALPVPAPGFRQVSCVKRPMEGLNGEVSGHVGPQVLQVIYSDGLTYVSVFIEPFDARRHMGPLPASVGPMQTLTRQHGDSWITVVGDVPPATLHFFAQGLEHAKK
jgi:sigma-E factor negative regulatory protein RseB